MASHGLTGTQGDSVAGRTVWAVAALLGLVLLMMIAGLGYVAWQEYRTTIDGIETRAANAAHTAEEHARWMIEAAMQSLSRVDDALAAGPQAMATGEVGDLQAIVRALPGSTAIWVFDKQGNTVLKTDPQDLRINIVDSEYFQALANGAEWQISPLLASRAGDRNIFTISRRLERDGKFAGAAVVDIPADMMSAFYETLGLGPRSSISLIRSDGWIVARHPQLPASMDLSDYVLFTKYLPQASSGIYHAERSPADGEMRVVAYRQMEGLPLIAIVGLSKTAALESLWSRLRVLASIGAGTVAILLLLSGWVIALLRRDEQTRQKLQRSLEQNAMLLREIHHRVKNNLQIVSSLVHLQPTSPEIKREMTRRIEAMAAVHEQIYRADQFTAINLAEYLQVVCNGLGEAFGKPVQMRCQLESLRAHIDVALPLGLIASEIVANALKHAFPNGRSGTITVALERQGSSHEAILRISDDGVGLDPVKPASGLGMRLLQAFAAQIGGSYRFDSDDGTFFILSFPLQEELRDSSPTDRVPAAVPAVS